MVKRSDLNDKQRKFCEEFVKDFNGGAAYKRAGYNWANDNSAYASASKLLRLGKVQAYISQLQEERKERNEIQADRVLEEIARIAFSDITDVVEFSNDKINIKSSKQLSKDVTCTISSINNTISKYDNVESKKTTVKLHDKMKALTLLSQHLGLTSDFNTAIAALKKYGLNLWHDDQGWHVSDEQSTLRQAQGNAQTNPE